MDSQARAIANNIYRSQNSNWVGATYRDSTFIRKLNQEITNNWTLIKGSESLILQAVNRVFSNDNTGARSMSKHLSGYAFDIRVNSANYTELNNFVRTLPGFHQFLTQEGGLAVWHMEFNEAPVPANNFQATHKVVTNDGSGLRLRNASGVNASIIGSLTNGSFVQVLSTGASWIDSDGNRGNWTYISTQDGRIGWCFGAYLQPITVNNNTNQINNSDRNTTSQPNRLSNIRNSHDGLIGTKWEYEFINAGYYSVKKRVLEFYSNSQARIIDYYGNGDVEDKHRYEYNYEPQNQRWVLFQTVNGYGLQPNNMLHYITVTNNELYFSNSFGTDAYRRIE